MIQIIDMRKPNSSETISLDDFVPFYRSQLFGNPSNKQIDIKIERAINNHELYGLYLNSCQISCLKFLLDNHEMVIYGKPIEHELLISKMKLNGYQSLIHNGNSLTPFGEKIKTLYNYDNWFRSNQERGIWFAKHFRIKTCPYCNSQYTLYITRKSGKGKAKFQFDHFFPKELYPYLSISMFNLIPSCYNCNHNKSSTHFSLDQSYHPYLNSISQISNFYLDYPDDFDELLLENVKNMDIEKKLNISYRAKVASNEELRVRKHNAMFDIDEIYNNFKPIAHRLLILSKLNGASYRKSILPIRGLFEDENSLIEFVLQTSLNEEKILDQAMSKFILDISRQLRLI